MVFNKIKNRKGKIDKVVVLLLILFISIYSFMVIFMINVQANGVYRPIIYTFDENKLTDEIYDIPEFYNVETSIAGYSDNYSDGYSMNESDISSIPSFVSDYALSNYSFYNGSVDNDNFIGTIFNGSSEIVENIVNHYNVLNFSDNSFINIRHYFSDNLISETIEYYVLIGNIEHNLFFFFREGVVNGLGIYFDHTYKIRYYDGSYHSTNVSFSLNTWYHIKIQLNCSDKWYLWINDILIGNNGFPDNNVDYVDSFRIISQPGYQTNFFFDAFGCTENPHYTIGQNIYPIDTFGQLEVIDNYLGHSNVLQFKKNKIGSHSFNIDFENQTFGNLSFWMLYNPNDMGFIQIRLLDENDYTAVWLSLYIDGIFKYYADSSFHTFYENYYNNTWIHLNIEFNSNTELYNVYINNNLIESDIPFAFQTAYDYGKISYLKIQVHPDSFMTSYFDSFDCSWLSDYSIRNNLIPIKTYQEGYQMDNFEFDYNPSMFENDETRFIQSDDSNNNVFINKTTDYDSELIFLHPNYTDTSYNKANWNFSLNGNFSKFQSKIELVNFTQENDSFVIKFHHIGNIEGYDCKMAFLIKYNNSDSKIYAYVDNDFTVGWNYVKIGQLENDIEYDFQVIFDFDNNYYRITFEGNGNRIEYLDYFSDISFNSYEGIHNLEMYINNNNDNHSYWFKVKSLMFKNKLGFNDFTDYTEYEYAQFQYFIGPIYFNRHNLFSIDSISQNKIVFYNSPEFNISSTFSEFRNQNGLETLNLWKSYYYGQAYLGFNIYGNFTLPTIYKIFGVKLIYEFKVAYPTYEYIQSEILTNYYYVNNSKLYYHFSRSSTPFQNEIMKISFSIEPYTINNKDISYIGYITNSYQGSINITNSELDLSKIYNLPSTLQTLNQTITTLQDKSIDKIEISVKCSNDNIAQGYANGYVESISFIHSELLYDFPDIDETIQDVIETYDVGSDFFREGMIFCMLRLIIFLLPVLIGRILLGNKSVIPLWLLMALVLFIVAYIPFWMIIIQSIAIFGMIIIPKKEVDN